MISCRFIAMPMWFVGGFRVHRGVMPFVVLIILYNLAGFIALVPYWNEPDPRTFMLQSLYLAVTAIFFVAFFNERTDERISLCLKAFAASTIFGAVTGIIGYFNVAGTGEIFRDLRPCRRHIQGPERVRLLPHHGSALLPAAA